MRPAARERIGASSMRVRASSMAAASQEHAGSLTSPLFVSLPLAECSISALHICCGHSTEQRGVRPAARERIRASSMRARALSMAAAGREHAGLLTSSLSVSLPLAERSILATRI